MRIIYRWELSSIFRDKFKYFDMFDLGIFQNKAKLEFSRAHNVIVFQSNVVWNKLQF